MITSDFFVNDEAMKAAQKNIVDELKSRGFRNVFTGASIKQYNGGSSFYVEVWDNSFIRQLAKFRISNHSVTNIHRVFGEVHVMANHTAKEAVRIAFNDNNADLY